MRIIMARLIAETPVLSGSDARRFEEAISNVLPLSSERRAEMDAEYRSFTSKVIINIWLVSVEENPYTRSMYFDMMEMEENTE